MTRVRCSTAQLAAAVVVAISCLACAGAQRGGGSCPPSSCGDIQNITYPFRLRDDPAWCGDSRYELTCEEGNHTILSVGSHKYLVRSIWYQHMLIQVVDIRLCNGDLPLVVPGSDAHSLYVLDGRFDDLYVYDKDVVNCSVPVEDPVYVDVTCFIHGAANSTSGAHVYALKNSGYAYYRTGPYGYYRASPYGYYRAGPYYRAGLRHLAAGCSVAGRVLVGGRFEGISATRSCSEVHDILLQGYHISWRPLICRTNPSLCYPVEYSGFNIGHFFQAIWQIIAYPLEIGSFVIAGRAGIGYLCLLAYLVYKFRRRHLAMDDMTENFLSEYKSCMPTRYSYRQIKKMTHCFKEKLGQGGFGSVYKGKLLVGHPVAIKMLGKSKGNGQEFMNEVATIGRIHHANVVRLLGFCAEGSKRALVYEFMSKGSLDKYMIPQGETTSSLSWDKLLDIVIGIARGMEYLHCGCNMQILHFDIKPHNILLDENFHPKISDFGLAKLYPVDDSKVSITAVRGTIGYIAPELFYRKFGSVSNKADVYSFGMLLIELTGKRRNGNVHVDQSSSQMYFPSWIYSQLEKGGDMGMVDATLDERDIAKRMIVVALWCIQMKPTDRPTISKVLEMLESNTQQLEMPAKPFLSSPNHVTNEDIAVYDDELSSPLGTSQDPSEQMKLEDSTGTSSLV